MAKISKMAAFCIILADQNSYLCSCGYILSECKMIVNNKMDHMKEWSDSFRLCNGDRIKYQNGRWHYVSYMI